MQYRVHRFVNKMTKNQAKLEQFLNRLQGEVIAMVPDISIGFLWFTR